MTQQHTTQHPITQQHTTQQITTVLCNILYKNFKQKK
jgi:hypothetical protein